MKKQYNPDVTIVGAGPAGSYLAWKLAEVGINVLVVDSQPLSEIGQSIEIFHMDIIRFDEFGIPHPQGNELLHRVDSFRQWFPDKSAYYTVDYPFYVMHMPSYIQRIQQYGMDAGVSFLESAKVTQAIFDQNDLVGVSGEDFEIHSKVVVDASGIKAVVRTQLPDQSIVENIAVPPEQTFYCCLELRDDLPASCPTGNNGYTHAPVFWNKSYGDGAVLGTIMPASADLAWQTLHSWREAEYGDPGKLIAQKTGCAPFRRAPFSLVDNGFLGVGDAVYQNKAFSGEGVTSAYTACVIAVKVILDAFSVNDFSAETLWSYNEQYFHGQEAKFAATRVVFPQLSGIPIKDQLYLYQQGIFFNPEMMGYLNRNYEFGIDDTQWEELRTQLLQGMNRKKFSQESLATLEKAYQASKWIKDHYLAYPDNLKDFSEWEATARHFWGY